MSFSLYILRRFLLTIPLILGITVVAFLIANAIPADPINANLPQSALNNPEIVNAFRAKWGLDKPPVERYLTYLGNLMRGDLGQSIKTNRAIAEDIGRFLPATIELSTVGILIGIALGVLFGIISAVWRNSVIDYLVRVLSLIGVSFPIFLLALLALNVFHAQLGWLPGPGRLNVRIPAPPTVTGLILVDSLMAGNMRTFQDGLLRLILPGFTLALYVSGIIARITRSSLLEVLSQDYIRTARAKGLTERTVIAKHALRNALIPVVTIIGLMYGNLLVGSVLIESIFAWPGIGLYMFRASTSQDFPAIMGVSMLIAIIYVGVNFVVDLLYYFIDPRIRLA
jgi:peptide/nickel transport system permease protein